MEGPEAAAGVVEDAVQHDVHVPGVGRVEQLAQRCVAAQQRVDLHVVKRVIAVVGGRCKDRVQVDGVDAKFLQVVEAIDNAVQVAPLEALLLRRAAPRLEAEARHVRRARAARKAVGEYLIKYCVFHPVWSVH